jgi:hypothetical protein
MVAPRKYPLVLSIYPNSRGLAFVVFEGPFAPIDWGTMAARGRFKNRACLRRISALFGEFQPTSLVLQNTFTGGTPRTRRIRELNEAISVLAETQGIVLSAFTRNDVRQQFSYLDAPTKHQIAVEIAKHVPAFERLLPPIRRPWMSEDNRMGVFDAAALLFTFYRLRRISEVEDAIRL